MASWLVSESLYSAVYLIFELVHFILLEDLSSTSGCPLTIIYLEKLPLVVPHVRQIFAFHSLRLRLLNQDRLLILVPYWYTTQVCCSIQWISIDSFEQLLVVFAKLIAQARHHY